MWPCREVAARRGHAPVAWHAFASETFAVGREDLVVTDTLRIGIYTPRSDAWSTQSGYDTAKVSTSRLAALRRWLQHRDPQPAHLLAMADAFPTAEPALRAALQVLL